MSSHKRRLKGVRIDAGVTLTGGRHEKIQRLRSSNSIHSALRNDEPFIHPALVERCLDGWVFDELHALGAGGFSVAREFLRRFHVARGCIRSHGADIEYDDSSRIDGEFEQYLRNEKFRFRDREEMGNRVCNASELLCECIAEYLSDPRSFRLCFPSGKQCWKMLLGSEWQSSSHLLEKLAKEDWSSHCLQHARPVLFRRCANFMYTSESFPGDGTSPPPWQCTLDRHVCCQSPALSLDESKHGHTAPSVAAFLARHNFMVVDNAVIKQLSYTQGLMKTELACILSTLWKEHVDRTVGGSRLENIYTSKAVELEHVADPWQRAHLEEHAARLAEGKKLDFPWSRQVPPPHVEYRDYRLALLVEKPALALLEFMRDLCDLKILRLRFSDRRFSAEQEQEVEGGVEGGDCGEGWESEEGGWQEEQEQEQGEEEETESDGVGDWEGEAPPLLVEPMGLSSRCVILPTQPTQPEPLEAPMSPNGTFRSPTIRHPGLEQRCWREGGGGGLRSGHLKEKKESAENSPQAEFAAPYRRRAIRRGQLG